MFMYPISPVTCQVLENVSSTFLSDSVFLHGRLGPTHKCIAKQLRYVKRKIDDPVALPTELDPRTLNAIAENERSWYAQSKDAFLIYDLSSLINQLKYSNQNAIDQVSVFPRSKEYEYQNIVKKRLKNVPKEKFLNEFQCNEKRKDKNKISSADDEPCYILKPPFWWKDKSKKKSKPSVESINYYGYNRPEYNEQGFDHVNHNIQTLEKDTESIVNYRAKVFKDGSSIVCPIKEVCDCIGKESDVKKETRWQTLYELTQFPKTDKKRKEEFRMLTKPYLHELNTWYGKNLPTKLHLPVRWKGKRPIPEWRFSHM
ncbi:hypothetical protein M0802_006658 [Mischocyttarus mexicanus]|nr:hypothetical protein M0802_006658 [Mischocyttarus mexicanus]